jgi:hypothetical protein
LCGHVEKGLVHLLSQYPASPREDEICFYDSGKRVGVHHVRTEYKPFSLRENQIDFYENGKHVRTEFKAGSLCEDEIWFYENNKHVRSEFKPHSFFQGQIYFYEGDKHVRIEFKPGSPREHEIWFYDEGGKRVRSEFKPGSPHRDKIFFYDGGRRVRICCVAGSPTQIRRDKVWNRLVRVIRMVGLFSSHLKRVFLKQRRKRCRSCRKCLHQRSISEFTRSQWNASDRKRTCLECQGSAPEAIASTPKARDVSESMSRASRLAPRGHYPILHMRIPGRRCRMCRLLRGYPP